MGRVEATQDGEIPQLGEPIGSFTPKFQGQENQAIGSPWSTGLFDCHEHQTNGNIVLELYFLVLFCWFLYIYSLMCLLKAFC